MALARARRVGEIFVRTLISRAWWAPPRRPSPTGAGLSHMEFSMSRPCERRDPYGADSHFCTGAEAFFRFLGPGVMGPCVRRDDPRRDCAKPRPSAEVGHMR